MEIFGIGPFEVLLVLVLALVVLGPQDMVKSAYRMGRAINRIVRSPTWRAIATMSMQVRDLPTRIVRETALEEPLNDLRKIGQQTVDELKQTGSSLNQEVNALAQDVNTQLNTAIDTPILEEVTFSPEMAPDLSVFSLLPQFAQAPIPPPAPPAPPADLPTFNLQPTYHRN